MRLECSYAASGLPSSASIKLRQVPGLYSGQMARSWGSAGRWGAWLAVAAIVAALWIGALGFSDSGRHGLFVAALIGTVLLVASAARLIVLGMKDKDEDERPAHIKANGGSDLNIENNDFFGNRSALDAKDVKGIRF